MSHNIRPVAFWVLVAVWRWGNCYRCPSCGKQTEKPDLIVVTSDDQQTRYWNTTLSTRISLIFSVFIPPLSCGISYKDNTGNGMLDLQENWSNESLRKIFQGGHQQSDKEPRTNWQWFQATLQHTEQQGQGKQQTGSSMDR